MSGIFGFISSSLSDKKLSIKNLHSLALHGRQRGNEFCGFAFGNNENYKISQLDCDVEKALNQQNCYDADVVVGFNSAVSCLLSSYQPFVKHGMFLFHDGIIINEKELSQAYQTKPKSNSEFILEIAAKHLGEGGKIEDLSNKILSLCEGTLSAVLAIPHLGKAIFLSNCGSLYVGKSAGTIYFASEKFPLIIINCDKIKQILHTGLIVDIPKNDVIKIVNQIKQVPHIKTPRSLAEEALLQYYKPNIKRCTKCILPETMPYITFDNDGVCNFCRSYKARNKPKPKEELFELVKPYRKNNKSDCIVPFSGGRDSSYSLHLIINELKMKPITYTYDWGMVTELGHRNISRMCSKLGVENIAVVADIRKKRQNIENNLKAWLKSPHLGMVTIITAGDKHFFKYIDTIKKQTGINLNLWGINPLEVTHFKSGFLGIKPDFEEKRVYMPGVYNQLRYQKQRLSAMIQNPSYFNSSLWDTLSGEYYRSCVKKEDYYHVFDYWQWDEKIVDETLKQYDWELAPDTNTTWRIGDGTAALYNYIYYTVAGFTEHDTFRSNQIREGQITREEALRLVEDENRPRYENIRWYLDIFSMDFTEVISIINSIPKLYKIDLQG